MYKRQGLFRCIEYQCLIQSYGFYLRSDNFIEKLPIFCAKNYPQKKWYERDIYFTTSDKGEEYLSDKEFLKCCLIWTCLSRKNKCLSFDGLDGRHYKNELCFDGNTLAIQELKKFDLSEDDKEVTDLYYEILDQAKLNKTGKFNPNLNYGVYQIDIDVNIFTKNDDGSKQYVDSELNSKIEALRGRLSTYYEKYIQSKLFKYELLK